jgi:VWFA-related protein
MNQGSTKSKPHPAPCSILAILFAAAFALGPPTALTQTAPPQVQSTPSPTGQPQYTIRARVPLTIVDVTVTDAKGNPVHNLKQSDFTLLEDNHEMQPNSFEEHRTDTAAPEPSLPQQSLPPNTFANSTPALTNPSTRPLNILLLDSLNTAFGTQTAIRQRMIEFIDKMPTGTRMEILDLGPKLAILQGFTDDHALLKAAINNAKSHFSLLQDPQNGDPTQEPVTLEQQGTRTAMRNEQLLASMRQVARFLAGLPGRKNLIWTTGAFALQFPPQPADPDVWPSYLLYDNAADVQQVGDLLARAHVSVFPIDNRGVRELNPRTRTGSLGLAERATDDTIADQTGGHAFYNTNDFAQAAQDALDKGSNFYTLTYTPSNQNLDTRFRTITVKVSQPNLHLTYRNGYYAVDPDTDTRGKKIEKVTPMQAAMMRGSLDATQILFRVKVVESPTPDTILAAENQPDPKQMKPPYRHYSINYLIDVHGIDFAPSSDGNYRGDFEYGVRVYNADGDEIVNSTSKTVSPILLPAVYRSMLKTGANAHRDIDVPATGDYFLRIAVHDLTTNRVGSIEIPTSSINPTPAGAP